MSIVVENRHIFKGRDTDIEKELEDWLVEKHIPYEKQEPIGSFTLVDFFIPPNICLYADGDYWHSSEKVVIRDRWITRALTLRGFKVIRLRGSAIKQGVRPEL